MSDATLLHSQQNQICREDSVSAHALHQHHYEPTKLCIFLFSTLLILIYIYIVIILIRFITKDQLMCVFIMAFLFLTLWLEFWMSLFCIVWISCLKFVYQNVYFSVRECLVHFSPYVKFKRKINNLVSSTYTNVRRYVSMPHKLEVIIG